MSAQLHVWLNTIDILGHVGTYMVRMVYLPWHIVEGDGAISEGIALILSQPLNG